MKRLLALFIIISMLLTAGCAWGQPEEPAFEIRVCLGPAPTDLDPQSGGGLDRDTCSLQLFEGLTRYEATGEAAGADENMLDTAVVPGQAASWEVSEDGLTYTFHLRDDVYWSDGTPVTAFDFVFAWRRLADPAQKSPGADLLTGVVAGAADIAAGAASPDALGVSAPDRRTFVVTLEQATPWFPELAALPALSPLPESAVKEFGAEWATAEHLLTNGPFAVAEWPEEGELRLVRNEYYYDTASVGPDALVFCFKDTEAEILQLYENDGCQFIQGFPTAAAAELGPDCHNLSRPGQDLLWFSCDRLPDWRVRAALALAVDEEKLTQTLAGGQVPRRGLVDPFARLEDGSAWGDAEDAPLTATLSAAYPDFDLSTMEGRRSLAARLLEEAKASGFDAAAPLTLICGEGALPQAVAGAVRDDICSALDITVEVEQLDRAAFDQALSAGDFDLARIAWQQPFPEAEYYLAMFGGDSLYNYSRWRSLAYDNALTQIGQSAGEDKTALLYQAEQDLFAPGGFPARALYGCGCLYAMKDIAAAAFAPRAGYVFRQARPLPAEEEEKE